MTKKESYPFENEVERAATKADHYTSFGGRMHHIPHRFLRYLLIAIPAFFIDFLILWILTSSGLFYLYSAAISFAIGHSFNYIVNTMWAFRDSEVPFFEGYYKFILFGLIGLGITGLGMYLLTGVRGMPYLYSKIVVAIIVSIFNFVVNFIFTFKVHKN